MFPEVEPRETLRFEGNKLTGFLRDQSLSDLLYSTTKTLKKGGHLWTFTGNSALLPSYIRDFTMLSALSLLVRDSFIVRCHVTSK